MSFEATHNSLQSASEVKSDLNYISCHVSLSFGGLRGRPLDSDPFALGLWEHLQLLSTDLKELSLFGRRLTYLVLFPQYFCWCQNMFLKWEFRSKSLLLEGARSARETRGLWGFDADAAADERGTRTYCYEEDWNKTGAKSTLWLALSLALRSVLPQSRSRLHTACDCRILRHLTKTNTCLQFV